MTTGDRLDPALRPVTIHMGVQKTASTALHHFLGQNRAALASHLMIGTPRKGTATRRMGRAAADYTLEPTAERRATFVAAIEAVRDEILSDPRPALISHENLPGAMLGNPGITTLYPMIETILALLEEHLAPLTPVYAFYSREMSAWKKSVYNQSVKTDRNDQSYADFLQSVSDCGNWEALEARMAAVVGPERLHHFRLEDEADPLRPGQALLALAGLDPAVLAALEPIRYRPNESLGPGALEFMRLINKASLGPGARWKVMQTVVNNPTLFTSAPVSGADTEERR